MSIASDIRAIPTDAAHTIVADFIAQVKALVPDLSADVVDEIEKLGTAATAEIEEAADKALTRIETNAPSTAANILRSLLDVLSEYEFRRKAL